MKNFYFSEEVSGEEFLVGAHSYEEAYAIALDIAKDLAVQYGDHPFDYELEYHGTLSDWEAENSGLDEY